MMRAASPEGEAEDRITLNDVQSVRRLDMAARHERALSILKEHESSVKTRDAKAFFVNVMQTNPSNPQQMKGACMSCLASVSSTGCNRFCTHLIGCPLTPAEVRQAFTALRTESNQKSAGKREAVVLANEEAEIEATAHAEDQARLKQQNVRSGLKAAEAAAADQAIAKFFYANGIGFSSASSEPTSLYREMVRAIQSAPVGYTPPNRTKLSGPLLDECYDSMWRKMDERDPNGILKSKFGSTYVNDGWDSCDNLPLINSAFITANDGGMYWRSVDTSGKVKSAEYCALLMILDIYEFGPTDVVLLITDTCSTMAKAWAIVEDEFPWISILPCQPHVISLLLKGQLASMPKSPAGSC